MRGARGSRYPDGNQSEYAKQQAEHNYRVEQERKAEIEARKARQEQQK